MIIEIHSIYSQTALMTASMVATKPSICAEVSAPFFRVQQQENSIVAHFNIHFTDLPCGPNAFRCRNKRCIRKSAMCDGIANDCGPNDNSDEASCSLYRKCTPKQFQCESDQYCISKQFRCNGVQNCDDGSDEIDCKVPICGFGACSQICLEKKSGNYNCRCADGYSKGPGKNDTCVSNEEPLLLIASDRDLRFLLPLKQMDNEVHGRIPVSKNKIDVFDVRILPDTIFLYWITTPKRYIQKLTTTAFSSNFKRKTKRAIEQEALTIVRKLERKLFCEIPEKN